MENNSNSMEDDFDFESLLNNYTYQTISKYFLFDELNTNIIKQHKFDLIKNHLLSIIHLNARSLFNKMYALDILCKQIDNFFNLIIITETWLYDLTAPLIHLENYKFVFKNRTDRKGGGVGIFINQLIEYTVIENQVFEDNDIDILCLNIKSKGVYKAFDSFNIIIIYRPPTVSFDYFLDRVNQVLNFAPINQETYIVGDFNVDLLKLNHQSNSFKNLLYSHFFIPTITSPTRVTSTNSSLLDNIFTNNPKISHQGIIVSDFSDHYPVFLIANEKDKLFLEKQQIIKRSLTEKSLNLIKNALSNENWLSIISESNVDMALDHFYLKLDSILEKYAPLKSHKPRNIKNWVTKYLISLSNKKQNYLKQVNKNQQLII